VSGIVGRTLKIIRGIGRMTIPTLIVVIVMHLTKSSTSKSKSKVKSASASASSASAAVTIGRIVRVAQMMRSGGFQLLR
jgi:hypothetical protein